jgi:hypothetical protein
VVRAHRLRTSARRPRSSSPQRHTARSRCSRGSNISPRSIRGLGRFLYGRLESAEPSRLLFMFQNACAASAPGPDAASFELYTAWIGNHLYWNGRNPPRGRVARGFLPPSPRSLCANRLVRWIATLQRQDVVKGNEIGATSATSATYKGARRIDHAPRRLTRCGRRPARSLWQAPQAACALLGPGLKMDKAAGASEKVAAWALSGTTGPILHPLTQGDARDGRRA